MASLLGNASSISLRRPDLHPNVGALGVGDAIPGLLEGLALGTAENLSVNFWLGTAENVPLGTTEGSFVGMLVGTFEGSVVGIADGSEDSEGA